jgi:hypothetical protein
VKAVMGEFVGTDIEVGTDGFGLGYQDGGLDRVPEAVVLVGKVRRAGGGEAVTDLDRAIDLWWRRWWGERVVPGFVPQCSSSFDMAHQAMPLSAKQVTLSLSRIS